MSQATSQTDIIERLAGLAEIDQLPRVAGHILAFMIVAPGTFSLQQIADQLGVSRSSVSTNARALAERDWLRQVSIPGDRLDYYELVEDVGQKMIDIMALRMFRLARTIADAGNVLPRGQQQARDRLFAMADLFADRSRTLSSDIKPALTSPHRTVVTS